MEEYQKKRIVWEPGMRFFWYKMNVQLIISVFLCMKRVVDPFFYEGEMTMWSLIDFIMIPFYVGLVVVDIITKVKMHSFARDTYAWLSVSNWLSRFLVLMNNGAICLVAYFAFDGIPEALQHNIILSFCSLMGSCTEAAIEQYYFYKRRFLFSGEPRKKPVKLTTCKRYRIGDDITRKTMTCTWCKREIFGKLRYCRKCGRTYCSDCGIRVCKCGGTVIEAPEEMKNIL